MKGEPKYYYKKVYTNGVPKYEHYPFKANEKENYELICDLVIGWGGYPCDIDWAKNTRIFKEAEVKLNNLNKQPLWQ